MVAFINQGREGKSLSGSPVDSLTFLERFLATLEDLDDLGVEGTIRGQDREGSADLSELLSVYSGIELEFSILDLLPLGSHPALPLELQALAINVGLLHLGSSGGLNILKVLLLNSLIEELLAVDVLHGLVLLDNLVHERLGERGLIKLVVAEFTVANQVHNYVSHELLAELCGKLERALHILHGVSIDVEDRRIDALGYIGGVLS